MRLLIMLSLLLLSIAAPAGAAPVPVPASTQDMLHLSVQATGVRLRAGAGTEFAIVGVVSRENESARQFLAHAVPRMDSEGQLWFRLLGSLQQQEDLGFFTFDRQCWIRSDFVKTRALSQREAELADSQLFRILAFAPHLLTSFRPAAPIPAFSDEKLCFFPQENAEPDTALPAGESYLLFNALKGERTCVGLWRAVDEKRIRFAGSVPLDLFLNTDLGADRQAVEQWLEQKQLTP